MRASILADPVRRAYSHGRHTLNWAPTCRLPVLVPARLHGLPLSPSNGVYLEDTRLAIGI